MSSRIVSAIDHAVGGTRLISASAPQACRRGLLESDVR
jgi:hypothetical protein